MTLIRKDKLGLYAFVGGYVARPFWPNFQYYQFPFQSSFKEGDKTEGKHFGSSLTVGMGKLKGRGKYKEYWYTNSITADEYKGD